MNRVDCIEIKEEDHLKFIAKASNFENFNRLLEDFKNSYFNGYICKYENSSDDFLGYVLYYYSYSTWESRVIYVSSFGLPPSEDNVALRSQVFESLCLKLIQQARHVMCSRINYNLNVALEGDLEKLFVDRIKAFNLSKMEQWVFFRMDNTELQRFAAVDAEKYEISKSGLNFKIRKINTDTDCAGVRQLVHDLAVFEKLEDQFRLDANDLKRDHQNDGDLKPFYDCYVTENTQTNEIVSIGLFYYTYSLNRGRGCYLEDLYVKPEYRNYGIGTLMWRKVSLDCLKNKATYLEWNCLEWNTFAIDFYLKNGAYNTTQKENLNLVRIRRERIYQD